MYLDELRIRVANRSGSQIMTKPDAQRLRDMIFEKQNEYLSESTIRRFFNLIPSGKISRVTLDVFSRFIGFSSYLQFAEFCEKIIHFSTTNNTDLVILEGLKDKEVLSMLEVNLIAHRINQCILESNYPLLQLYFNSDQLFQLLFQSDTAHDLFAQVVGPFIENEVYLKDLAPLLDSAYFIPLVLHKYVDIQNKGMERYYEWIVVNSKNPQDLIFSASILTLNALYSKEYEKAKRFYILIDQSNPVQSPVLNGRIALLNWIFDGDLDRLMLEAKKYKDQLLFFSIDIISYLVYVEELDALTTWFSHFPDVHPKEKTWVEKEIFFFYNLAKHISLRDISGLRLLMDQKVSLLNSKTTFGKIYLLIEERYFKNAL